MLGFEADPLASWDSPRSGVAGMQKIAGADFVSLDGARAVRVPVLKSDGGYVLLPTRHGERWVRDFDVRMTALKCVTSGPVRIGGDKGGAVSSGLGTGGFSCK